MKQNKLSPLEEAGLGHFKTIVFDAVKINLTDAITELIDRERKGIHTYVHSIYFSNSITGALPLHRRHHQPTSGSVHRADLREDGHGQAGRVPRRPRATAAGRHQVRSPPSYLILACTEPKSCT